jgi:Zn finger protein HypA/HybF involved in hydrogenase expression
MDELMLDGNAVAGLLQEVFAVEMTSAIATCNECGGSDRVGALQVFRGAGIVMRCPHCDNALVTIVEDGPRRLRRFSSSSNSTRSSMAHSSRLIPR